MERSMGLPEFASGDPRKRAGLTLLRIPEENIREGNLVKDMPVFGVKSLNA